MTRHQFLAALLMFSVPYAVAGCSRDQSAELAKAKYEAEAARAELAQLQAAPQPAAAAVQVKSKVIGEIYATTKGGDTKKAAGVAVHLIPLTRQARDLIADALGQASAIKAFDDEFCRNQSSRFPLMREYSFRFGSPEEKEAEAQRAASDREAEAYLGKPRSRRWQILQSTKASLLATAKSSNTNSDGRFQIECPEGAHILLTNERLIGQEKLVWVGLIHVSGAETNVSLDHTSATFGPRFVENVDAFSVSIDDEFKAIQKKIGPDLDARIQEAYRLEAASLQKFAAANPPPVSLPSKAPVPEAAPQLAPSVRPAADERVSAEEKQMRIIFKDWAARRGEALKNASKMPKREGDAYMKRIDQGLVKTLTAKYKITHEELDRIEDYGARKNWW